MTKLKLCPFCSRHLTVKDALKFNLNLFGKYFYIECQRCFSRGPKTILSEEKAVELWNKRGNK